MTRRIKMVLFALAVAVVGAGLQYWLFWDNGGSTFDGDMVLGLHMHGFVPCLVANLLGAGILIGLDWLRASRSQRPRPVTMSFGSPHAAA